MSKAKEAKREGGCSPTPCSVRLAFEKMISAPPFERSVSRFGDPSAFPGDYEDIWTSMAWHAFTEAWQQAVEAAIQKVPGGQVCDPQNVADEIRELMIFPEEPNANVEAPPESGAAKLKGETR